MQVIGYYYDSVMIEPAVNVHVGDFFITCGTRANNNRFLSWDKTPFPGNSELTVETSSK